MWDTHRQAPCTPGSGAVLEEAGDFCPAPAAGRVLDVPSGQLVPVAAYQWCLAVRAVRGAARFVVDVAGIDVAKACLLRDAARPRGVLEKDDRVVVGERDAPA